MGGDGAGLDVLVMRLEPIEELCRLACMVDDFDELRAQVLLVKQLLLQEQMRRALNDHIRKTDQAQ